jgi:hypothetical protein
VTDRLHSQPNKSPEDEQGEAKLPEPPLPGRLVHQPQEIALDDPESRFFFQTGPDRQLMVTPAALSQFGMETIMACLFRLQHIARARDGMDYFQVFLDPELKQELWFIEDAPGVVTALLPEDR